MTDGVLMFDVHTTHKMDTLFNNQSYIDESEDIYLGWEAVQGEEKHSVWHDMSFFIKKRMDNTNALMNHIIKEPILK